MMIVYISVRGENHEGATPIESPIKGYQKRHQAVAVCRREHNKSSFGLTDYTAVWKIEIQND